MIALAENRSINLKQYKNVLSCSYNKKGVLDIDTVKGCFYGLQKYPNGGCYGECYAYKNANLYGIDFSKSITRKFINKKHINLLTRFVRSHDNSWYRIGVAGDPCHDWNNTIDVISKLQYTYKTAVIVTKHWIELTDDKLNEFKNLKVVINTSTSGLDTDDEIKYRVDQFNRIKDFGIKSILRVVTCHYGNSEWAKERKEKQEYLLSFNPVIDNPLRASSSNLHVVNGDILLYKINESVGGGKFVSLHSDNIYLGNCKHCLDQCGVDNTVKIKRGSYIEMSIKKQESLFKNEVEFEYVKSVIGSGYETKVADLAIRDKVAYRAARKNMQIHSAIILKINGEFSGFFTFQVNHEVGEFCLLQSAMELDRKDPEIYKKMVQEIIKQNSYGYPMIMTVSTKHDLECPKVFEAIGFKTYLNLSGFEYMVYGTFDQIRMKRLAHATMTNAWTTTRADWLKLKKEWNEKIEEAGERHGIKNPKFASRDGCWQGVNGLSNIVLSHQTVENDEIKMHKEKSLNSNASVLDPVACEVILRFFMPRDGKRIYNPFGGGVQFGFIAGSYGYEYIASEIRANQCDANNALCSDLKYPAKWIKSDSSKYIPEGKFDLCFSCPPYYKVEKYLDYDGNAPDGELNTMSSYEQFRDTLFDGYKIAISVLNDNCFFVIMTGDSRDSKGAYYGCEAEHEIFLKEQGLSIYNKIVYLECEFTRLAQAKTTLNTRKFPKREQKIIVAYKGNIDKIKDLYPPIGRL